MLKSYKIESFFIEIGELSYFARRFFKELFSKPFEFKELLRQCYSIGNRSILLVTVTGFIIGLVITLQTRPTLEEFGAESWMPSMVSISIIREIGPVIIALTFAGRIASGIGAELGSMRVTEQIDAMEVSGTNPFKYLVVTRILAATLMLPILKPKIILYDEPTSGLDPITSKEIIELMRNIQKQYKTSSLIITHDVDCARVVSERMILLVDGINYAEGTFTELEASNDEKVKAFFK